MQNPLENDSFLTLGVEYHEAAVERFFVENNLNFSKVEGGDSLPYYVTTEGVEIRIYVGDLYRFKTREKFDLIWDRGSRVAINPDDRGRYAVLIGSLLSDRVRKRYSFL